MSISTGYFQHLPTHAEARPDRVAKIAMGPVVEQVELERHRDLITPERSRMWLERGALMAHIFFTVFESFPRRR